MSITLRFVGGAGKTDILGSLVSRTIAGAELGFWADHVEALTPDGTLLGAHAKGGVQARPKGYDGADYAQDLYVTLPATDIKSAAFYATLASQIGKPYDMAAIGEMAVGVLAGEAPDWQTSPSWICSALQIAALLTAGIVHAAPATVRLATPRDVMMMCAALVPIDNPQSPLSSAR